MQSHSHRISTVPPPYLHAPYLHRTSTVPPIFAGTILLIGCSMQTIPGSNGTRSLDNFDDLDTTCDPGQAFDGSTCKFCDVGTYQVELPETSIL